MFSWAPTCGRRSTASFVNAERRLSLVLARYALRGLAMSAEGSYSPAVSDEVRRNGPTNGDAVLTEPPAEPPADQTAEHHRDANTAPDADRGTPGERSNGEQQGDDSAEAKPTKHAASAYGPRSLLPDEFANAASRLEKALEMPVWFLVQKGESTPATSMLGPHLYRQFHRERDRMKAEGPAVLVIDSGGGYAQAAFQIANLFRRHAGGFVAVVPRYAKSAATLLTLGADEILMGEDAELGPLDAQLWDPDREEPGSALDEVQALERLHTVALEQLDQTMILLQMRTPKKTEILLPIASKFSTDMMVPLLDKVDTVHYARQARVLKVAEDYAVRLLHGNYGEDAKTIADKLVNGYPEHGFVIDRDEADSLLGIGNASDEAAEAIANMEDFLVHGKLTAIGRLEERGEGT